MTFKVNVVKTILRFMSHVSIAGNGEQISKLVLYF